MPGRVYFRAFFVISASCFKSTTANKFPLYFNYAKSGIKLTLKGEKMKIFLAGVKRQFGVGKESGNAYDMYNLLTLVPSESGKMGAMNVEASGYQILDLRLAPEAFQEFRALKYPCTVEIVCEPRPFMGKYVTTAVSLVAGVVSKAA
jgi:hypothetical protein